MDGLELAGRYYADVVAPLLRERWPDLPHAAARLGSGSDVLGLDDADSRDHDWGLRLTLLVGPDHVAPVDDYLETALPETYAGLPTRFTTSWEPQVRQRVQVDTPTAFARSRLGVDVHRPLDVADWLALPGQSVLEVVAGRVFHDGVGEITEIRKRLAWYPDDVWYHVVATDWSRISTELLLLGRTGQRGDDLGSRAIAGRLVQVAMHLGLLLERRWPPYPKWLGTEFARLPSCGDVAVALQRGLQAATWTERQRWLGAALGHLYAVQRTVGLPADGPAIEPFYERPFWCVARGVTEGLQAAITDPRVQKLPTGVGSVEQWVDNPEVLMTPRRRTAVAACLNPPQDRQVNRPR